MKAILQPLFWRVLPGSSQPGKYLCSYLGTWSFFHRNWDSTYYCFHWYNSQVIRYFKQAFQFFLSQVNEFWKAIIDEFTEIVFLMSLQQETVIFQGNRTCCYLERGFEKHTLEPEMNWRWNFWFSALYPSNSVPTTRLDVGRCLSPTY